MIFLMHYDPANSRIIELRRFDDQERRRAEEERLELELELVYRGTRTPHEIVLLEASSEQALRRTHRRYFETLHDLTT
jgi:hypothetical protein